MHRLTGFALAALAALVLLAGARAGEEKLKFDKVPKAVMDAVKAKYPGAKLLGASSEKDGDKVVYEISLKYKDQHHDVSLEADGKIVSIEREIAFKDLPKVVADTLKAKYPNAKYKVVEELLKGDGTLHAYEALLTAGDTTVEVVLDLKGKILKEEKMEKKEKK
jgi:hypothetical protein